MSTLKRGDKGDEVKKLQERLNFHGASLVTDGDFGPMTESAVKVFQLKNNLTVNRYSGC